MFRLRLASLQHACRWLTFPTLITNSPGKPNLVQSRSIVVPYTQVVSRKRSFFTSSSVMQAFSSTAYLGAGTLDDIIARSKGSSDVQQIVLELPEVARIPIKRRTFHLGHGELETHVRPLLSCDWHVGRVGDVVDDLQVFSLNKLFTFKDFRIAVEFFGALADIQDEENHHARVTVDLANVYVSTHTHVAHYQRASDADADAKPIRIPGLTARDIRFAVRVERLHERFLSDDRAVTKVPMDTASLQAWSMEQLRQRYPADGTSNL